MTFSTSGWRRRIGTIVVAGAISALGVAGVASAAKDHFDITGTIYEIDGSIVTIVTSDVIGKPQPIMVDVSQVRGIQPTVGTPIQLRIWSRENDTFLAREIVAESPYVNGADFGVRESFTTRQSSIQAGVGNVPEDDEALNKQHRDGTLRDRNSGEDDDEKKNR